MIDSWLPSAWAADESDRATLCWRSACQALPAQDGKYQNEADIKSRANLADAIHQRIATVGSPCRVRQVDALYEHGKAVTDFVLRARVPPFVLLPAWLRDATCEVRHASSGSLRGRSLRRTGRRCGCRSNRAEQIAAHLTGC